MQRNASRLLSHSRGASGFGGPPFAAKAAESCTERRRLARAALFAAADIACRYVVHEQGWEEGVSVDLGPRIVVEEIEREIWGIDAGCEVRFTVHLNAY